MGTTRRFNVLLTLIIGIFFGCVDDSRKDRRISDLERENAQLRQALGSEKRTESPPAVSMEPCNVQMLQWNDKMIARGADYDNQSEMRRFRNSVSLYQIALSTTVSVSIPSAGLPELPSGEIRIVAKEKQVPLVRRGNQCTIGGVYEKEREVYTYNLESSWVRLAQLVLTHFDFHYAFSDDEDRYAQQVDFFCSGFIPFAHGMSYFLFEDDRDTLRFRLFTRLKAIAEDEQAFKAVMSWVEKSAPVVLSLKQKAVAKSWLPDFWGASGANMALLDQELAKEEKEYESKGEEEKGDMSGLLWDKQLKREGLFLRRWRNAGKGKAGDDRIVMYRFWIVRLAKALDMPQASEWAETVNAQLKGAKTLKYRAWYQSQL